MEGDLGQSLLTGGCCSEADINTGLTVLEMFVPVIKSYFCSINRNKIFLEIHLCFIILKPLNIIN